MENNGDYDDVFTEMNGFAIVPGMSPDPELNTKMSEEWLDEDWHSYKDFIVDNEYHKYEIEWTP